MPTIADAIKQAFATFQAGKFERSEWWCRQALQYEPHRPEILNLLGSLYQRRGDLAQAIAWYKEAIDANPKFAEAYNNMGVALHRLGHLNIALAQFEAALSLNPNYAQAYFNCGNALLDEGQIEEAQMAYEKALTLKPDYTTARNNLANLLQSIGEYQTAIALYRQSIAQTPNSANAHMNLANLLQEQGNLDGAMVHYSKAIELDPHNPTLLHNIALAQTQTGNSEQAIQTHYQVLRLKSQHAESHHQLGCLLKAERPTAALAHFQQAITYQPDFAEAFDSIGQIWRDRMEIPAAISSFRQAVKLDPDFADAQLHLADALLIHGNYADGFAAFEYRWESQNYLVNQLPRHRSMPQWDGSNLEGKTILLWAEQDIRETLLFSRFISEVGGEIYLECDRQLVELFTQLPGVKQIIPRGEAAPKCDFQASLMSLPKILGTELESLPTSIDLGITPQLNQTVQTIGIALESEYQITLSEALRQYELIDLSGEDFAELAHTIAGLDLVIATDNAIAHLAATLGQNTWVLLEYSPHWMWQTAQNQMPWYPTAKLFRQPIDGDWANIIQDVIAAV